MVYGGTCSGPRPPVLGRTVFVCVITTTLAVIGLAGGVCRKLRAFSN